MPYPGLSLESGIGAAWGKNPHAGMRKLGTGGGSTSVRQAIKLTAQGKLVGDVFELCNGHGGQKLGKATVCVWVKAVVAAPPGNAGNVWGIIKSTSLYAPSRYVQFYAGVDSTPAERLRASYDVGGGNMDDPTPSPAGHGYLPQSLMVLNGWKHFTLVKTGDPDVNTYTSYTDGVLDCHGNGAGTPAEMDQLWMGFDGNDDFSPFSFAYMRIWRDVALSQAQVQAERLSRTPVLATKYSAAGGVGLFRNWPMQGIADLTDTVDGAVLTASGTAVTDAAGPTL